jgi:hypothetical protein
MPLPTQPKHTRTPPHFPQPDTFRAHSGTTAASRDAPCRSPDIVESRPPGTACLARYRTLRKLLPGVLIDCDTKRKSWLAMNCTSISSPQHTARNSPPAQQEGSIVIFHAGFKLCVKKMLIITARGGPSQTHAASNNQNGAHKASGSCKIADQTNASLIHHME